MRLWRLRSPKIQESQLCKFPSNNWLEINKHMQYTFICGSKVIILIKTGFWNLLELKNIGHILTLDEYSTLVFFIEVRFLFWICWCKNVVWLFSERVSDLFSERAPSWPCNTLERSTLISTDPILRTQRMRTWGITEFFTVLFITIYFFKHLKLPETEISSKCLIKQTCTKQKGTRVGVGSDCAQWRKLTLLSAYYVLVTLLNTAYLLSHLFKKYNEVLEEENRVKLAAEPTRFHFIVIRLFTNWVLLMLCFHLLS